MVAFILVGFSNELQVWANELFWFLPKLAFDFSKILLASDTSFFSCSALISSSLCSLDFLRRWESR